MPNRIRQILLLLLFSPIFLSAQEAAITSITTADGLSQGMIFDILKDKDGFIWFATKNGLNRYDGYNFKVFNHDPFDSLTVSGDVISRIFEDSKGRMWVGTESNGLNYFDKENELFYSISTSDSTLKKLNNASITGIVEDTNGTLWVAIVDKVFCLKNIENNKNQPPKFDLEWMSTPQEMVDVKNDIAAVDISNKGKIFIRRRSGVYQWKPTKNEFESTPTNTEKEVQLLGKAKKSSAKTWTAGTQTLSWHKNGQSKQLNVAKLIEKHPRLDGQSFKKIFYNSNTDELWITFYFNSTIYTVDANLPFEDWRLKPIFLLDKDEYFTHFFLEDTETLWVGTNGYGVRKMNIKPPAFKHFLPQRSISIIFDLAEKGLFLNYKFKTHLADFAANRFPLIDQKYAISNLSKKIIKTKNGKYYAIVRSFKPSLNNGIHLLNQNLATEQVFSTEDIQARYGLIQEDAAGNLWMPGQEDDFLKFNVKTGTFTPFNAYEIKDEMPPVNIFTQCLYKDGQGVFWKGVRNGLLKLVLNEKGEPVETHFYQSDFKNRQSLSNNSVASCLDDPLEPDTYLWVGTKGGGLNKLNKKTGEFKHFTIKDGLPDNVVYGILADDKNTLWLSTNRGLSNYDHVEKTFKNYTKADGLQDDEFNTGAYYKNEKTGELYFGGINGLTAFFPKDLQTNTKKPKVYLTNLKIHNETIEVGKQPKERGVNPLKKAIPFTEKIDLDWHQNQISLEFAALDFDVPEKNRYQYRLSNVDNDWVQADKNRLASYANLAPGSYLFEVKGTNSSGVWNETPTTLEIIIHPPWWNTWWFYAAVLALLFFIIYQIYQAQINRAKLKNELLFEQKEAERLAELNRIKANFFSNITHEFRTPLTLILEPLRQLLKEDHTGEITAKLHLAKNNSERLLRLVNQLLDVSKLEAEKMALNLKKGYIQKVIEPIVESFLPLAVRKGIHLKMALSDEIEPFYFDNNHVEKVVYNLLSNAIKYSDRGSVILKIGEQANLLNNAQKDKPNNLIIKVIDKGIGIPKEALPHIFDRFYQVEDGAKRQQGTGIGLALTKELVELMGGTISVKSSHGKGTTFTVKLPMKSMNNEQFAMSNEREVVSPKELLIAKQISPKTPTTTLPIAHSSLHIADLPLVLLIEDNDELRHFIKQSIAANYQVVEAENGAIGIEKALDIIPDFIISDLMMPEKNGFEVVKTLKNDVRTSHIPIVLLTAKTAMDSRLKGLRGGADDYLTKPFNTEELLIRMGNLIEIRRQLQVKFASPNALQQVLKKSIEKDMQNDFQKKAAQDKAEKEVKNPISPIDTKFLNQLTDIIQNNLGDENFSVEILAEGVSMSRSQLFRKVKAITAQTPNEFIRNYRLDQAMKMLKNGNEKIIQIAAAVGFKDEKYFSKRFKLRFEQLPSEVRS